MDPLLLTGFVVVRGQIEGGLQQQFPKVIRTQDLTISDKAAPVAGRTPRIP